MRLSLPANSETTSSGSLASMIDIIFLLIIFFVVTASFDKEQLDSAVILPEVSSGIEAKTLPPSRIVVNVFENGDVKLGFTIIKSDDVLQNLSGLLRELGKTPDAVVIVNGAADARHKHIAAVLESAAKAGFDDVRINAEILLPENTK